MTLHDTLHDTLQRPLHDLRISVTDRCNLRCTYCMPAEEYGEHYRFLPRVELLSFEELARIARVAAGLGVRKVRLTGGEPLLRRELPDLVRLLRAIPGVDDIALTTNGLLLPALAVPLRQAGLDRVTVSLDSLDPAVAGRMNGRGVAPEAVLAGIEAARSAGFRPIKVNVVVQHGVNDAGLVELAAHFRGTATVVRFIEYMDVGTLNRWRMDQVLPARDLLAMIDARFPLRPVAPGYAGEVASRYAYADGAGEIGFITSVTQPFCGTCTRLRLSSDGKLFTCLFAAHGTDVKGLLRGGGTDAELDALVRGVWTNRADRYSEERATRPVAEKVEMYHIGG